MAKGTHFRWTKPPSVAWKHGAALYVARVDMGIGELLNFWAPQIERSMQHNAIWIDRTSNARQTLACFTYKKGHVWVLVAKQHMEYGVYLEGWNPKTNRPMKRGKKYAIVMRTIHNYYPRVWGSVRDMLQ